MQLITKNCRIQIPYEQNTKNINNTFTNTIDTSASHWLNNISTLQRSPLNQKFPEPIQP